MKYTLLYLLIFVGNILNGQQNVVLEIQHMLKDVTFAFNKGTENNMGHAFTLRRMDYYLSGIEIVHDGGQKITFPDVYVLVSLDDNQEKTIIDLGSHTFQTIEKIHFYLGIDSVTNHSDPALYPIGHPLGPRFPSMHWGWASGYRFIALEGKGGPANNQEIQLHALGNQYYQPMTFDVTPFVENNTSRIVLTADYTELFYEIPIKQGVIVHGSDKEVVYLADNFIKRLFTAQSPTSVNYTPAWTEAEILPNPAQWFFTVKYNDLQYKESVRAILSDSNGRIISEKNIVNNESWFVGTPGMYFLHLYEKNGNPVAAKKVVIH